MKKLLLIIVLSFAIFAACDEKSNSETDADALDKTGDIDQVEDRDIVDELSDKAPDAKVDEDSDKVDQVDDEIVDEAVKDMDVVDSETDDEMVDEPVDETVDLDAVDEQDVEETDDESQADNEIVDESSDETPDENVLPTVPEITSTAPTENIKEGYDYSYNITCTDADGDSLTISVEDDYCNGELTDNGDGTAVYSVTELGSACEFTIVCSDLVNTDKEHVYFSTLKRFSRVKDIRPGSNSSNPAYFNEVNGKCMFYALNGSGSAYYTTDGTSDGTVPFFTNPAINTPVYTRKAGDTVFASHNQGEIWVVDGTEAGTKELVDVCASEEDGCAASTPLGLSTVDDTDLYVYSNHPMNGSPWVFQKIWKSDGTSAGTTLLYNGDGKAADISQLTASQGVLFFIMSRWQYDSENGHGKEVVYINPASNSEPVLVKEIRPDNGSYGSSPDELTDIGNKLLFTAYDTDNKKALHSIDLTQSTTDVTRVTDLDVGTYSVFKIIADKKNNRAFLILNLVDTTDNGEVWVTNGNAGNFTKLGTFNKRGLQLNASEVFDGVLYFCEDKGTYDFELWKSDGTVGGTVKITDLDEELRNMVYSTVDNRLYYSTDENLYVTDGTDAGTEKLSGINVKYNSNGFSKDGPNIGLFISGTTLYISGRMSSSSDTELYKYEIVW